MIYAVGDVHGEAQALAELLASLPVEPADKVVFLGDLINRGAQSYECVEIVLTFDRCSKVFLMGNHEETMLSFLESGDLSAVTGMEFQPTLDSYSAAGHPLVPGNPDSLPESHMRLYALAEPWTLPFYITDSYIFTHAGWNLSLPVNRQSGDALRWGRVIGQEKPVWTQTVVHGHTPSRTVVFSPARRRIGVDTGCGLGGYLSAVALPEKAIYAAYPKSYRKNWKR
jgi:serine/threonine protein phosphatase 1